MEDDEYRIIEEEDKMPKLKCQVMVFKINNDGYKAPKPKKKMNPKSLSDAYASYIRSKYNDRK